MRKAGLRKHLPHRSHKAGLPPGTLVYVGRSKKDIHLPPRITLMEFDGERLNEREVKTLSDVLPLKPLPTISWLHVDALHDESLLTEFGEAFHLNQLLLEDILNTEQRPKHEAIAPFDYIILKIFDFDAQLEEIATEQVSIVIGENFLLTFMEEVGNEFEPVRERLRNGSHRLRSLGPGYLAYSLLDTIVDGYFNVLEKIGERLEELEGSLVEEQPPNILQNVHRLRRELIFLRKNVWPVREIINNLQHSETDVLNTQIRPYLRDLYDHTIQVMDTLESYRDLLASIQDLYLSVLSYRMNDVIKVLTVISTIFIPLTFIVGVYGMNFRFMPELDSPWGYPAIWLVMLTLAVCMLFYFRRKHWI